MNWPDHVYAECTAAFRLTGYSGIGVRLTTESADQQSRRGVKTPVAVVSAERWRASDEAGRRQLCDEACREAV